VRAILTYHSIDPSGSPISLDPGRFAEHLDFLTSGRVDVVPLTELMHAPPQRDVVAITFDDGLASFATEAWPRLRDYSLPVTLFVVTRAGTHNDWGGADASVPPLPLLGVDDLARLAADGVALGAHSRTHPRLEQLDATRQREEIVGAADDLEERTGARPSTFCYPFGTFDERAVAIVAETYDIGCTTDLRPLGEQEVTAKLPRLDAYYLRSAGTLEAWGTRRFARRLRMRRTLRRARGALTR
jgi:peptidoglycan/xylan/chitin deacetylase (PgdA/CDA1 family)